MVTVMELLFSLTSTRVLDSRAASLPQRPLTTDARIDASVAVAACHIATFAPSGLQKAAEKIGRTRR
jgi:hypothetical protein